MQADQHCKNENKIIFTPNNTPTGLHTHKETGISINKDYYHFFSMLCLSFIFGLQNDKSLAVLPDSTHTCLSSGIVDLTRPVTGPRQSGHLLSLFSLHSDESQGKLASEILKTNLIV